jgi:hypothetical protein
MRIEPKPRDTGVEFTQSLVGQNVDRVFVPSVEKGVMKACEEGILAGYRVVDVKIDFYDGKMHPVDSKDIAFQIAGYFAFKECFMAARACLLEPIHTVEIRIPEDCMGKVMGDLSSRRGKIQGMDSQGACAREGALPVFEHAALAHWRPRSPRGNVQSLRRNAAGDGAEGHRGKQEAQAAAGYGVGACKPPACGTATFRYTGGNRNVASSGWISANSLPPASARSF